MTLEKKILTMSPRATKYQKSVAPILPDNWVFTGREVSSVNELCGSFKKAYSCTCQETKKIIAMSCNHLGCNTCFTAAASLSSEKILERTVGTANRLNEKVWHVSLNPPESKWEKYYNDPVKFIQKAYDILKNECSGGTLIYHPYRFHDNNWYELKKSPHIHLIVSGPLKSRPFRTSNKKITDPNVSEFALKYKMNYTTLFKDEFETAHELYNPRWSPEQKAIGYENIKKVAFYQLTHCAWFKGGKSFRYFGKYHPNKSRITQVRYKTVDMHCEKCNSLIYEISEFDIVQSGYNNKAIWKLRLLKREITGLKLFRQDYSKQKAEYELLLEKCKQVYDLTVKSLNFDDYLQTNELVDAYSIERKVIRIKETPLTILIDTDDWWENKKDVNPTSKPIDWSLMIKNRKKMRELKKSAAAP